MYQLVLFAVLCASALTAGLDSLPSNFKVCSRNSGFDRCLAPAIQAALGILTHGSKPLGVPSIDPFKLSSLGINQGGGSSVAIDLKFTDLSISGISKVTIDSLSSNLDGDVKTLSVKISAHHPLTLVGKYTINGKVLVLPISGAGNANVELMGTDVFLVFSGKIVTKNGMKYLVFHSVQLVLNPKQVSYRLENLFNGDKALGDNMNLFLNENWEVVFTELKDPIQKAFASTFIDVANRIFTKVPYDAIFPPQ